jgi:hypothetical protein
MYIVKYISRIYRQTTRMANLYQEHILVYKHAHMHTYIYGDLKCTLVQKSRVGGHDMHIHTYIYTHTRTHMHRNIRTCIYVSLRLYAYIHNCSNNCVCTQQLCMYASNYIRVFLQNDVHIHFQNLLTKNHVHTQTFQNVLHFTTSAT